MKSASLSFLCLIALAGCSNPEKTGRHLIDPPAASQRLPDRLGLTELREVSLPQYAAGQEITWQTEDGALRSTPENIWADDPARAMTLALSRQITALSGATVIAEPWPLAEGPSRRLEVRVEQILAQADGNLRLSGVYFVSPAGLSGGRDIVRRFDLTVPVAGEGPGAIARAQSRAVALLAEQIAQLR
ncbi:PqiC family protein [Phaeovulum sp. NW3]|uniref:PqiC family protein n=1 Tax=Phaeovulum sp. NW3 TaxID=2934933 RepID=UPI00201FDE2B|nr:PqiC family protein [Phaeovulum sp. NW3]MCL7466460.1 PqiC family protein [Phaeovulum sp. NW3]